VTFRVLFVCTGNICRSPTAEGVFRAMVRKAGLEDRIETDSAGTHAYHVGDPPDERAVRAARRRGWDISDLRARKVEAEDFDDFDLILALDRGHLRLLERMRPRGSRAEVRLFLTDGRDVPDPYYGGPGDFDRALDLVEEGAREVLARLKSRA